MKLRFLMAVATLLTAASGTLNGQVISIVDFETSGGFTPSFVDDANEFGDFFRVSDGSDITGDYTGATGSFFAAQDIDGVASTGATSPATVLFDAVDISGQSNLLFSVDLAEDDDGTDQDWDDSDFLLFEYSIDGGAFTNLLAVENDGSEFNSAPLIDTDFDGTGDGAEITNNFANFQAAIADTGDSLVLRATFALNAGDEDIAVDNVAISVAAIPEPASATVLGLGALGCLVIRRRK